MKHNTRRTSPFLLLTLLVLMLSALFAGVLTACGGTEEEDPPAMSGDEVGVYYAEAPGSGREYLLTLSEGLKFSFIADATAKNGSYSLTDGALTLTDGDWTLSAAVADDAVTLTYEGTQLKFLRKIYYTVSFETAGGTAVADVEVLNGKTLAKPAADPSRGGYVFVGWFADEAGNTPYAFDSQPVSGNLTLYARWLRAEAGEVEYTISYDLGYAGGEEIPDATTVGGKLFSPAVPAAREGFSFVGWWVSMENKADRLSYRFEAPTTDTNGTVFDSDTTLFAVWQADGAACDAPAVSVSVQAISWDAVDASAYRLNVTAPDGTPVLSDYRVTGTTYPITFDQTGAYRVEVTAVNAGNTPVAETVVRYYVNNGLSRVSGIRVTDPETLIFRGVEHAEKYLITVDCGNPAHKHEAFDNGTSLYYSFINCDMKQGGMVFTVQAVAEGYATSTATFVFERSLAPVQGAAVQDDVVTWEAVEGANYYLVQAGQKSYTVSGTQFSLKELPAGEYNVSVTPVAKGSNSPAAAQVAYTKQTPALPADVRLKDTVLSWTATGETGVSYQILVNGQKTDVPAGDSSYDLTSLITWAPDAEYTLQLCAVKGGATAYSDAFTFTYLALDETLSYEGGVLSWKPVAGAQYYEIMLNGELIATANEGETSYTVASLGRRGVNTLSVRFVSESLTSEWAEITVNAQAVTFNGNTGTVGTFYKAQGDAMTFPEAPAEIGYEFAGWYNTPAGPESFGALYEEPFFTGASELVLYAYYEAKSYTVNFSGADGMTTASVQYGKPFTFEVPASSDPTTAFGGWYSAPYGAGIAYTDAEGNSLAPWNMTQDGVTVYAFWVESVLSYTRVGNSYVVSAGPRINLVESVTIPAQYNGVSVTELSGSAFAGCTSLKEINLPDTLLRIPADTAFAGCTNLAAVNVYEAGSYQPRYSSADGVLFDSGDSTAPHAPRIAYMPLAKTGRYIIPEGSDLIPRGAFAGSMIESVVIPASVTAIEAEAFADCTELSAVTFSNASANGSALTIGDRAFAGCTSLETITLPVRLAQISLGKFDPQAAQAGALDDLDDYITDAFSGCTNLEAVNVAAATGTAGAYRSADGVLLSQNGRTLAYVPYAKSLTDYVIPDGVTSIGEGAFMNTFLSGALSLPGRVTSVGVLAFAGTDLEGVVFEGGGLNDVVVGDYAFYDCSQLETLTFAEGSRVVELGKGAFRETIYLKAVSIPASMRSIGDEAFLEAGYYLDAITVTFAAAKAGDPDLLLGDAVFSGCSVYNLELPVNARISSGFLNGLSIYNQLTVAEGNPYIASVEHIVQENDEDVTAGSALYLLDDEKKFETLLLYTPAGSSPSEVSFDFTGADGVRVIAPGAFAAAENIVSVTIPASVTEIGDKAFYGIYLESVTFAPGEGDALTIGEYAFAGLYLDAIELPEREVYIGAHAFEENESVGTLTLGGTVEIGEYAFASTGDGLQLTVPASVRRIGGYAFEGYAGWSSTTDYLSGVTFAAGSALEEIGGFAFSQANITTITIPASVTKIGAGAFSESSLTEIKFEEGTQPLEFGAAFEGEYGAEYGQVLSDTDVTEVNFPGRLTVIGQEAFYYNDTVTAVTFGDQKEGAGFTASKLTTIGESAFMYSGVTELVIPASISNTDVIAIGSNAFNGMDDLTSVTFEAGGTGTVTIGESAFVSSNQLTSITLPATLAPFNAADGTRIEPLANGVGVFVSTNGYTSSKLASVNVAEGNAYYASDDGMLYASGLSQLIFCPPAKGGEVVVNASANSIAEYAFAGNTAVTKVSFEAGSACTEIGANAFLGCSNLAEIELPAGLKSIGEDAFLRCNKLTSLTLPDAFDSFTTDFLTESITTLNISANNAYYKAENGVIYTKDGKTLLYYLPSLANTEFAVPAGTERIAASAFFNNTALTKVTFPASLTYIEANAFQNSALSEVVFTAGGSELLVIGDYAFAGTELSSVVLPGRVAAVGNNAFADAALENVTFGQPSSLTSIGDGAFRNTGLTSVTLPEGVRRLGDSVFAGCFALVSATLSEGLTEMGDGVFAFGDSGSDPEDITSVLETVDLPASLLTMGGQTFLNCISLKFVNFAENSLIETLPANTFYGCVGLQSIELPASLTEIAGKADPDYSESFTNRGLFQGLTALTSVTFADGSKCLTIGASAFEGSGLASFNVPASLTTIEKSAFAGTALSEITIPRTVTRIEGSAFSGCSELKTVRMNAAITVLNDLTFQNCSSLETLILPATLTSIASGAFTGCTSLTSISVDAANSALVVDESGALYNAAKTELYFIPADATEITLPATLTSEDAVMLLAACSMLESVEVEAGNAKYQAAFGALYDAEWNLLLVPKAMISFTIPKEVTAMQPDQLFRDTAVETVGYEEGRTGGLTLVGGNYGEGVFNSATQLTEVTLPADTVIGAYAFARCSSLVEVTLTAGTRGSIGNYAFRDTKLTSLTVPEGFTAIGSLAFDGSTLAGLSLPASLTGMQEDSLSGAPIASVTLAEGNQAFVQLENGVLMNASQTVIYFIPAGLTSFEIGAGMTADSLVNLLKGISSLQSITVADGNPKYKASYGALYDSEWNLLAVPMAMTAYTIPKEVTYLGVDDYASYFEGTAVTTVDYEEGRTETLTLEGDSSRGVFADSDVREITLPEGVRLEKYALYGADSIERFVVPANAYVGDSAFQYWNSDQTIVVPFAEGTDPTVAPYNWNYRWDFRCTAIIEYTPASA